jgi:hypothetical protein
MRRPHHVSDTANGASASGWPRSRSCSPTIGLCSSPPRLRPGGAEPHGSQRLRLTSGDRGANGGGGRAQGSLERFVLSSQLRASLASSRAASPQAAGSFDAGPGAAAPPTAARTLLAALLPPGAAAEKERRDLHEYLAFSRRLGLFVLWREHARVARAMR